MSAISIVMMLIMIIAIWGGLVWAIFHLKAHPDETSGELGDAGIYD